METFKNPSADLQREVREQLEQTQMQLREARASLATAAADAQRAEHALTLALVEAEARRAMAAQRVTALEAEADTIRSRRKALEQRLLAKRKEDQVLARGAALRDKYVDWNPNDRSYRSPAVNLKQMLVFMGASLVLFLLLGVCGNTR